MWSLRNNKQKDGENPSPERLYDKKEIKKRTAT